MSIKRPEDKKKDYTRIVLGVIFWVIVACMLFLLIAILCAGCVKVPVEEPTVLDASKGDDDSVSVGISDTALIVILIIVFGFIVYVMNKIQSRDFARKGLYDRRESEHTNNKRRSGT